MIEVGFVFPYSSKHSLISELLRLPGPLCPQRMSVGEDEPGSLVSNSLEVVNALAQRAGGFFLKNRDCSYNIELVGTRPIECACFLEVESSQAKTLLIRLAAANPLFGFACAPEEREAKNRVVNKLGINTVESWVGRGIEKTLPGLYWCTLLPEALAQRHDIPLSALAAAAIEHIELDNAQHFFCFFENPNDWRKATDLTKLMGSLPGVFDVEKARERMAEAKTVLELLAVSKE